MQKYKHNRTLITIICDQCGKEYSKPVSEYKRNQKLGKGTEIAYQLVRDQIGPVKEDRIMYIDINKYVEILDSRVIARAVEEAVGPIRML